MAATTITITQRPRFSATFNWIAVANPAVYKFQRKDRLFNAVADSSGKIQVTINGVDVTANFAVGTTHYMQSDNGVYDLQVTVQSVSFSTNTVIVMEEAYISSATTGFLNYNARVNFRVEVSVFRVTDDVQIGPTIQVSPDTKGLASVNVLQFVKAYLFADHDYNFFDETYQDDLMSMGFYIKTLDKWTGDVGTLVSDSSNPVYAALAALQVPNREYGPYLTQYVPSIAGGFPQKVDLLTKFDTPRLWPDYPATVSYIRKTNAAVPSVVLISSQKNISGTEIRRTGSLYIGDADKIIKLNTIARESLESNAKTVDVSVWRGLSTLYSDMTQDLPESLFNTTTKLAQTFTVDATGGGWACCSVYIAQLLTVECTLTVKLCGVDGSNLPDESNVKQTITFVNRTNSLATGATPDWFKTFLFHEYTTIANEQLAVVFQVTSGVGFSCDFYRTTTNSYAGGGMAKNTGSGWSFISSACEMQGTFTTIRSDDTAGRMTNVKTFKVEPSCKQPIMLYWRNSLGGDSFWVFRTNQEYSYEYKNGVKTKRYVLFADNVTLNEFDALNELITTGEVYRDNLIEMTTSTVKTHSKVGQQVYIVDQAGNKTGVIVLPSSNKTKTKYLKHSLEIEIEMPEIFEP